MSQFGSSLPGGITILQLIPKGELVLSDGFDSESIESHRIVINNKLLDTAVKLATTPKFDVLIREADARELTPGLYNDLWDCLLVHGKSGKCDVRVVFRIPDGINPIHIWSAGPVLHPRALAGSKSLAEFVVEEAEVKYVLYDNPRQTILYRRRRVAMGGTFDHLHVGHKKLLSVALQCADELVIVGVTSDVMLASKRNKEKIEPLPLRLQRTSEFIASVCPSHLKCEVVVIDDPFGPTVTIEDLDGIVCSSETLKGAVAVNTERQKRGFKPLVPILVLRSNVYSLSSTFIRDKLAL